MRKLENFSMILKINMIQLPKQTLNFIKKNGFKGPFFISKIKIPHMVMYGIIF